MKSAFLALLFIFSINFAQNFAANVRMTSYHITSRAYKSNASDVPGSVNVRSIVDCARQCEANEEDYFYYDKERHNCYCNNGTDDNYFTASYLGNDTEIYYGYRTAQSKMQATESSDNATTDMIYSEGTTDLVQDPSTISPVEGIDFCTANLAGLELSDCLSIQNAGCNISGVYNLTHRVRYPSGIQVFCDMVSDGGGWIIFQRREDGSVNFSRSFVEYEQGFGDVTGEHWLGLRALMSIAYYRDEHYCEVRIELEDWNGTKTYVSYLIWLYEQRLDYMLNIYGYKGTAGDSMQAQDSSRFSTVDRQSGAINVTYGGWWQSSDYHVNLNGEYINDGLSDQRGKGIIWAGWRGQYYSLKKTEMKLRHCYIGA